MNKEAEPKRKQNNWNSLGRATLLQLLSVVIPVKTTKGVSVQRLSTTWNKA
jgi:hypothetical protein